VASDREKGGGAEEDQYGDRERGGDDVDFGKGGGKQFG